MHHKPLQKLGHGAVRTAMSEKKLPIFNAAREACRKGGMGYVDIDERYVIVDKSVYDLKLK